LELADPPFFGQRLFFLRSGYANGQNVGEGIDFSATIVGVSFADACSAALTGIFDLNQIHCLAPQTSSMEFRDMHSLLRQAPLHRYSFRAGLRPRRT